MFNNLIPKIYYAELADGVEFFVGALGFAIELRYVDIVVVSRDGAKAYLVHSVEDAARDRPELAIETGDVEAIFREMSARAPQLLHPDSCSVAIKPWGSREFAMRDSTGVCVNFRQWPQPHG